MLLGIANTGAATAQQAVPTMVPSGSASSAPFVPAPFPTFTHAPCPVPNALPTVISRGEVDIPTKITETIGRESVRITVLLDDQGRVVDAHASSDLPILDPIGEKMGRATKFAPARYDCVSAASLISFTANISGDGLQRPSAAPRPPASNAACVMGEHAPIAPDPIIGSGPSAGQVKVEVRIDRDGNLTSATVASGPRALDRAALEAVRVARYEPAALHCVPREGIALVTVQLHS